MQAFKKSIQKAFKTLKQNKVIGCDGLNSNIIIDVYNSIKVILFKILRHFLKKQSFLQNLNSQKLFQFLKMLEKKNLKTTNQFLLFQFFPKCLSILCIIVCINISYYSLHAIFAQNFDIGKFTLGISIDF